MNVCRRCRVSGTVQGVWFRGSTQREAIKLGVTGYAVNLPDGSVEVLACGPDHAVAALAQWLWTGPPHAVVRNVDCETVEVAPPSDFSTG